MAKKKRKKRPQSSGVGTRPRPQAAATAPEAPATAPRAPERPSNRQARKEQARIERERRLRLARRRLRMRRLIRWGLPLLVIGAIVAFFVVGTLRDGAALAEAREAFGCNDPELQQDEIDAFEALGNQTHVEPFAEGENGIPATAGAHASALPPEPKVYDQPVPEANAVHNLEHGYVLIYYAAEGENALADDLVSSLESVAEEEAEVIMAPYDDLAEPVTFVSWGQLQTCSPPEGAGAGDAEAVARAFIDEFRNSSLAPEAAAG